MTQPEPTARLLLTTFRAFERHLIHEFHRQNIHDITQAHLNVIRHINPEGLSLSKLAKDAELTKQAVGKFVHELTHKGYLVLKDDPNDKRAKKVHFSPKGERMIRKAISIVTQIEADYQQRLCKKNYQQLRTSLQAIQDYHSEILQDTRK